LSSSNHKFVYIYLLQIPVMVVQRSNQPQLIKQDGLASWTPHQKKMLLFSIIEVTWRF
jgi:hypothetical protein